MEDQENITEAMSEEATVIAQTPIKTTSLADALAVLGTIVILGGGYFGYLHFFPPGDKAVVTETNTQKTPSNIGGYYHCGDTAFKPDSRSKQIIVEFAGKAADDCVFNVRVNDKVVDAIDASVVQRLASELKVKSATEINLRPSDSVKRVLDVSLDVSQRLRNNREETRSTIAVQFKDWMANSQLRGGDKIIARLFGVASYEKMEYSYLPCYKVQANYIPQNTAVYIKFIKPITCSGISANKDKSGVVAVADANSLWVSINDYYQKAFSETRNVEALPDIARQSNKIADDMTAGGFTDKKIVFLTPGDFRPLASYVGAVPRAVCTPSGQVSFIGLDYNDSPELKDQQEKIIRALFTNCTIQSLIYNNNP